MTENSAAEEVLAALRWGAADPRRAEARRLVSALAENAGSVLPLLGRDPGLLPDVLARPLDRDEPPEAVHRAFATATATLEDGDELRRVLRRLRHRAMVRIAAREVLRLADVDQTSSEMSTVAAAAIDAALAACTRTVTARHGEPRTADGARVRQVVLGMGKLGGDELNLGSDIDLVFFYETDDAECGSGDVTPHELFARIASRTARALSDVTEDGFAFRVDLRLRPEGSRGPLVGSLASAERYYETFGRTWERAALVRARPVAGDLDLGHELLAMLRPFVYRRAVDPRIAVEMTEMIERSRRELSIDLERDLKLGRGGIREIEFFVQTLQLVWGGRHAELRVPSTIDALRRLLAKGLVTEREARSLESDWSLLRRAEHRVQLQAGYQTHAVPEPGPARARFARSLGFASSAALDASLSQTRDRVSALFASLVTERGGPDRGLSELAAKVADGATVEELVPEVERALRVEDPHEAASHLARLGRHPTAPLGTVARERLPELGTLLLAEVRESASPDSALRHLAEFFSRPGDASAYERALVETPLLARRLVGLFGASPWLSSTLVHRPEALEDVLLAARPPTPEEIAAAHAELPTPAQDDDPELAAEPMRKLFAETTLAIGIAAIAGEIDARATEARVTALAEAQIRTALHVATRELEARLGAPSPDETGELPGMAVVGLGSLGAGELGIGGDLDLVFLYRQDGETQPSRDGRTATHADLYTKIAQRTLRLLSSPTPSGRGYSTDTRLRPGGSQGLLVVSRAAFERYHAEHAAAWERQALVRARVVAGNEALGRAVEALLPRLAFDRGPTDPAEVAGMRRRMELELAGEKADRYHPKLGFGGLTDVEFVVQWLEMRHADDTDVRERATRDALNALRRRGHLTDADGETLEVGLELSRSVLTALRLLDTNAEPVLFAHGRLAERVARRLGIRDRDGVPAGDVLAATWRRSAERVRAAFERIVAPVGTPAPWGTA